MALCLDKNCEQRGHLVKVVSCYHDFPYNYQLVFVCSNCNGYLQLSQLLNIVATIHGSNGVDKKLHAIQSQNQALKEDPIADIIEKYKEMRQFGADVMPVSETSTATSWFPHHCFKCDKKYLELKELEAHYASDHKLADPFLCTACGHQETKRVNMVKHMKQCDKDVVFHCGMCPYYNADLSHVMRHKMKHAIAPSTTYALQCPDCSHTCERAEDMTRHVRKAHGHGNLAIPAKKDKRFICEECGYKTASPWRLKHHKICHTGDRPYVCEFCGERFSNKNRVREHSLKHTGERRHKCTYCDYSASVLKTLQHHIRRKHEQDKLQRCHLCTHTCPDETQLRRHLRRKHDIECEFYHHLSGLTKAQQAALENPQSKTQVNEMSASRGDSAGDNIKTGTCVEQIVASQVN